MPFRLNAYSYFFIALSSLCIYSNITCPHIITESGAAKYTHDVMLGQREFSILSLSAAKARTNSHMRAVVVFLTEG